MVHNMIITINHLNLYRDNFCTRWKVLVFKGFTRVVVYTYKGRRDGE